MTMKTSVTELLAKRFTISSKEDETKVRKERLFEKHAPTSAGREAGDSCNSYMLASVLLVPKSAIGLKVKQADIKTVLSMKM